MGWWRSRVPLGIGLEVLGIDGRCIACKKVSHADRTSNNYLSLLTRANNNLQTCEKWETKQFCICARIHCGGCRSCWPHASLEPIKCKPIPGVTQFRHLSVSISCEQVGQGTTVVLMKLESVRQTSSHHIRQVKLASYDVRVGSVYWEHCELSST